MAVDHLRVSVIAGQLDAQQLLADILLLLIDSAQVAVEFFEQLLIPLICLYMVVLQQQRFNTDTEIENILFQRIAARLG